MSRPPRPRLLDFAFVAVLIAYTFAGLRLVPFHGDESTIIFMSRDWFRLTQGDFAAMYFRAPPPSEMHMEQDLRLLNGVTSKYAIGLAVSLAGMGMNDLNTTWDWTLDWSQNLYYGHLPNEKLLIAGRLSSAFMLALSVAVVFAIGWRAQGRGTAWLAALVYATMPAVLINGRRAMFEGAMLLTTTLVILAGLEVVRSIQNSADTSVDIRRVRMGVAWLLLGIASGLALASKHTDILTIAPVFVALLWIGRRTWRHTLIAAVGAGLLCGGIFFALNPAWWSAPLKAPGEVLRLRSTLISNQTAWFGGFASFGERIRALVDKPFGEAQYYEVNTGWPEWIGGQIAAYEASGLAGINRGSIPLAVIIVLVLCGAVAIAKNNAAHWLVIVGATVVSGLGVLALNPLPWQRYYLPLSPLLAILFGAGLAALANLALRGAARALRRTEAGVRLRA